MCPGGNQHVLYACAWHSGWEGLRWIRIIKAANVSKPPHPCNEEQWVPPHIFLSKCQTPPSPSTTSGFPPILCNIMAIMPIMAQLGTPYSCRYPSISLGCLRRRCCSTNATARPDIGGRLTFSHLLYFPANQRKSFREIKWKHLALVWLDGYPRSSIGRGHLHWPDGILLWHSESQYYYIGKKKINVDLGHLTGSKREL